MRCPKCGYISFDHLERCKKCGRNISGTAEDLDGTVYDTTAPSFLRFDADRGTEDAPESGADVAAQEVTLDLGEDGTAPGAETEIVLEEDTDLVLEEEMAEPVAGGEESDEAITELDLDDISEIAEDPGSEEDSDLVLELGEELVTEGDDSDGIQLDFGDIDISDLAPPSGEEEAEELTLDSGEEAVAAMATGPPPAPGGSSGGLEDLEVDGLDLDSPPRPITGSGAGSRLQPSVKTGTALDDFDIDLGDLLSRGEDEKSVDSSG